MALSERYGRMREDPERMGALEAATEFADRQLNTALWLGILSTLADIAIVALASFAEEPTKTLLLHNLAVTGVLSLMFGVPYLITMRMASKRASGEASARRSPRMSLGTLFLVLVATLCFCAYAATRVLPASMGWQYLCMATTCSLLAAVPTVALLSARLARRTHKMASEATLAVAVASVAIPLLIGTGMSVAYRTGHLANPHVDLLVAGAPPFPLSGGLDLLATVAVIAITAKRISGLRRDLGRQGQGGRGDGRTEVGLS